MDTRSRFPAFLMQPDTLGQISLLSLCFSDTGRNGLDSVAAGEWEMCVTGHAAKLWEMLFAGCGKAALAFPQAVNSIFHGGAASYAHFPLAFLAQSALFCFSSVAQPPQSCGVRTDVRQHSAGGLGNSPTSQESDRLLDQATRSVGAKRISLSIACKHVIRKY